MTTNYRNNRFNNSMHSLDRKLEGSDSSKASFVSDLGRGAERIVKALDYDEKAEARRERQEAEAKRDALDRAKIILAGNGYAYLISTLELIIENGNNRLLSIRAIMKSEGIGLRSARRRYERQRQALLEIFDVA